MQRECWPDVALSAQTCHIVPLPQPTIPLSETTGATTIYNIKNNTVVNYEYVKCVLKNQDANSSIIISNISKYTTENMSTQSLIGRERSENICPNAHVDVPKANACVNMARKATPTAGQSASLIESPTANCSGKILKKFPIYAHSTPRSTQQRPPTIPYPHAPYITRENAAVLQRTH